MSEIKYIGQMSSSQNSRVIDPEGISHAVTNGHKDGEPKIIERDTPMKGNYTEPRICTMVGRDPNNPSSRARSDHYEQFLEMGDDVSNTLTSVQKDNLVAEPQPIIIDDYNQRIPENQDVIGTITTNVGNSAPRNGFKVAEPIIIDDYNQRVPQDQDVIGTVTTQFGNPAPRHGYKIAEPLRIPQAIKQGYIEVPQGAVFDMSYPKSTTRRGRVQEGGQVSLTLMAGREASCYFEGVEAKVKQIGNLIDDSNRKFKNPQTGRIYDTDGLSPTVNTCQGGGREPKIAASYRIRKLTPRECFRLMGVTETDIDKIQQSGVSQSQQYKMAGNSIVVDCLYHMFRKMFTETACESQQLSLF